MQPVPGCQVGGLRQPGAIDDPVCRSLTGGDRIHGCRVSSFGFVNRPPTVRLFLQSTPSPQVGDLIPPSCPISSSEQSPIAATSAISPLWAANSQQTSQPSTPARPHPQPHSRKPNLPKPPATFTQSSHACLRPSSLLRKSRRLYQLALTNEFIKLSLHRRRGTCRQYLDYAPLMRVRIL